MPNAVADDIQRRWIRMLIRRYAVRKDVGEAILEALPAMSPRAAVAVAHAIRQLPLRWEDHAA